ncbi:outer membrane protein assembly factor BamB family protein [Streptomyces lonarensis]|uniref:PQQ-binding-like beta-propeller repeat protein n=1 Tax=Streptomyces lonarensis TaxID=700599 RepID=A0A7X6D2K4_9ACTN|nr:PQQ-binding-like beta-propeller repeat protein [Streptomyces lonarensis]NJQ06964.1 PQQ-binding-like beta-propeller repeat protein [Streptomyces lonarensis]
MTAHQPGRPPTDPSGPSAPGRAAGTTARATARADHDPGRRTVLGLLGLAVLTAAGCAPGADASGAAAGTDTAAEPGSVLWSFGTGRASRSPAVRYEDTVVCGSGETLHALDAADGTPRWEHRTGPAVAQPLHHGGSLHVPLSGPGGGGSSGGGTVVLDPADGSHRRDHPARAGVFAAPVAHGNTVYLCGLDRTVQALDAGTGAVRWTFETDSQIFHTPVLHDELLHVATADGVTHTLDTADGSELRRFTTGGRPLAPQRTASGLLLLADRVDATLHALDPATGEESWAVRAAGEPTGLATAGETVLLAAGRTLTARDAGSGEERWRADAARDHSPVTVVGATACHRSAAETVTGLDLATGAHRWSHEADGAVLHLATDGGVLYLGTDRTTLTTLAV